MEYNAIEFTSSAATFSKGPDLYNLGIRYDSSSPGHTWRLATMGLPHILTSTKDCVMGYIVCVWGEMVCFVSMNFLPGLDGPVTKLSWYHSWRLPHVLFWMFSILLFSYMPSTPMEWSRRPEG